MARNKSKEKKAALAHINVRNRRVPIFAIAKTKRKVRRNPLQRNWRRHNLDLKVE
ncbi:50S ribosomal protein L39e [Candidatus Micrarchaeota archaeon CG1_02_55_22]|nr:MAG: 50S ribosomal protein L39e [Candidatus Micrarchaeota archaeon CG1_02_55_22]